MTTQVASLCLGSQLVRRVTVSLHFVRGRIMDIDVE